MPYVVPLLARAGVLLCEPPETVGKAAWAGLGRRLGWMLGASFVCIRTSEDSQPTLIYHDTDQYLIRLLPWSACPCTLPYPCQHRCTSIRIRMLLHVEPLYEFANVLQQFRVRRNAAYCWINQA